VPVFMISYIMANPQLLYPRCIFFVFVAFVSLLSLAGCALDRYPLIATCLTAKLCRQHQKLPTFHLYLLGYPRSICVLVLSTDVFPSNDEVCVYLLEYVCSRGPLRPILCPALLHPLSLTRHICQSHLDVASPPHPAEPWLARLARCTGDLLVVRYVRVQGCNGV
jgi:hypothetical protein